MSAGYIQLAAIGQQDLYLTGNPEVTYFSGVYKRHTPFVLEAFDIPFKDQQVLFGKTNICRMRFCQMIKNAVTLISLEQPMVPRCLTWGRCSATFSEEVEQEDLVDDKTDIISFKFHLRKPFRVSRKN